MKNKLKGLLMQIPVMLIMIGGTFVSLILRLNSNLRTQLGVSEMSFGVFIIFLLIDLSYFYGLYLLGKKDSYF